METRYRQPIKELTEDEKQKIIDAYNSLKIEGKEVVEVALPIAKPMARKILGSIIRHTLQVAAGAMLAKGVIDPSGMEGILNLSGPIADFAVSGILYLIAQSWSISEKVKK